eukprot:scaffold74923_cov24-Cyclotella_meneghiniana.AAC.4
MSLGRLTMVSNRSYQMLCSCKGSPQAGYHIELAVINISSIVATSFGLECFAGKGLHKMGVLSSRSSKSHLVATSVHRPSHLDWNALLARVSTDWQLVYKGQASDCVDHNIQTIAAGPSQCLIMDILNDVMQFGLECFAGKGLNRLGIELAVIKISSCSN